MWPAVSARLHRMLGSRGLPQEAADDICQEVAWRVLSRGVTFAGADDLYPWAATVARRLAIDLHRRDRHLLGVEPPERAAPVDVVATVEARTRLRAVVAAMPSLSASDREAITEGLRSPAAASRREAVRVAVRRHRARSRLLALVEAAGAAVAWVLAQAMRRTPRPAGAAAMLAAPALVLALSISPAAPPATGDAAAGAVADRLERPMVIPSSRVAEAHSAAVAAAVASARVVAPSPVTAAPTGREGPAAPAPAPDVEVVATAPDGRPVATTGVRDRTSEDADVCVSLLPTLGACANPTEPLITELDA